MTDYYNIKLNQKIDDPLIKRKNKISSKVQMFCDIPLPSVIEISDSGTCNRSCSFCPRSSKEYKDLKTFINPSLIQKLANELSEVNYEGLILFSGFVEPLLNKSLYKHIEVIRSKNPNCRIEIITNGDPITKNNLNKLFYAGIDYLLVSCYDGPHQIDKINNIIKDSDMPNEKVIFRNRWLDSKDNFNISLSNRGGLMESAEYKIGNLQNPLSLPCFYPAYTFFMDYTGEVLMCSHDWGKKAVVGNMNIEGFFEIWTGKKFSKLRKALIKGNRKFSPCNICNVEGTRIGKEHSDAWN